MTPSERSELVNLEKWVTFSRRTLGRIARKFESSDQAVSEAQAAIADCLKGIAHLSTEIEAAEAFAFEHPDTRPLTEADCERLFALNRRLSEVTDTLRPVCVEVKKRMGAKVSSPQDPMSDYEIRVRIAYFLREDHPDYCEEDDNFLAQRSHSIDFAEQDLTFKDWNCNPHPAELRKEPHCWLFHDLYDHEYGLDSPALSFHDCLRIGTISVDVEISQYAVN